MTWNLQYQGAVKTLAEWHIADVNFSWVSQGIDVVRFNTPGIEFDEAPSFEHGQTVLIWRDDVLWFTGRVIQNPRTAKTFHTHSYVLAGPWWYLDKYVFQIPWNVLSGSALVQQFTSHLLLNIDNNGNNATTTQQIMAVLQYVTATSALQGLDAPFQFSSATILPGGNGQPPPAVYPPIDEVRDTTCAEIIRKQLRWHPTAASWFDYSTQPPTLWIQERGAMTPADIDMSRKPDVHLEPLNEQVVSSVLLNYEVRGEIDGTPTLEIVQDLAPPGATGRELNSLNATIDSLGARIQTVEAYVVTEPIEALSNDAAARNEWWKARKPDLARDDYELISISPATRSGGELGYTREVIEGQIADWMPHENGQLPAEPDTIIAEATFKVYDLPASSPSKQVVWHKESVQISHPCMTTDIETGLYSNIEGFEGPDPIVLGIAQHLYNQLSVLQWKGTFTVKEEEVSGFVGIGQTVNLLGTTNPAYATMNAMVQQVDGNIDSAISTVSVGPPPHLGPQDLVELTKVNRFRLRLTPSSAPQNGSLGSASVALGRQTANSNTSNADGRVKVMNVFDGQKRVEINMVDGKLRMSTFNATGSEQALLLDFEDTAWKGSASRLLKPRVVEVCVNNETRHMLVIASEVF